MSKVKLQVVEIGPWDAYAKQPDIIEASDVIEFDSMPKFETWELPNSHPSNGFDYNNELARGTNLRTGDHRLWCFHSIKFEKA
jgi:hypothetical protein